MNNINSIKAVSIMILIFGCYIGIFEGFGGGVLISLAPILYVLAAGSKEAERIVSGRTAHIIMCLAGLMMLAFSLKGSWSLMGNMAVAVFIASAVYCAFLSLAGFRISTGGEK